MVAKVWLMISKSAPLAANWAPRVPLRDGWQQANVQVGSSSRGCNRPPREVTGLKVAVINEVRGGKSSGKAKQGTNRQKGVTGEKSSFHNIRIARPGLTLARIKNYL